MKLLVEYGADPNVPSQRMRRRRTPRRPWWTRRSRRWWSRRRGRRCADGFDSRGAAAQFAQRGGGGGGGRGGRRSSPLDPAIDSAAKAAPVGTRRVRDSRRGRRRIRQRLRRQLASPRARRLDAGDEVSGRGAARRRQRARHAAAMTPLHHAAARGDNEMIRVPRGARRRREGRVAQRPDDGRHGERAGAATPSVPGDDRAAREARREEPAPLRVLLTARR